MHCNKCQTDLKECTCENLEERLDDAVRGDHFDYKKCATCGKHYARCKCKEPNFIMASLYLTLKTIGHINGWTHQIYGKVEKLR